MIAQIRLIVFIRLGEIDIDDNALLLGLPMVARSLGLGIIIFFISFCVVNWPQKPLRTGHLFFYVYHMHVTIFSFRSSFEAKCSCLH